MELHGIALLV